MTFTLLFVSLFKLSWIADGNSNYIQVWKIKNYFIHSRSECFIELTMFLFPPSVPPSFLPSCFPFFPTKGFFHKLLNFGELKFYRSSKKKLIIIRDLFLRYLTVHSWALISSLFFSSKDLPMNDYIMFIKMHQFSTLLHVHYYLLLLL